mgnify:CR=1 FL=1
MVKLVSDTSNTSLYFIFKRGLSSRISVDTEKFGGEHISSKMFDVSTCYSSEHIAGFTVKFQGKNNTKYTYFKGKIFLNSTYIYYITKSISVYTLE